MMKVIRGVVTVANPKAISMLNGSGFSPIKTEAKMLDDGFELTKVAYYALTKELNDYINNLDHFKIIRFKFKEGIDDRKYWS